MMLVAYIFQANCAENCILLCAPFLGYSVLHSSELAPFLGYSGPHSSAFGYRSSSHGFQFRARTDNVPRKDSYHLSESIGTEQALLVCMIHRD